ncbi:MAG: hypothetical protein MK212_04785 [Saprospiraceae bacterium]|nr:hypothetical protein [Saprospiraceae bacterium]
MMRFLLSIIVLSFCLGQVTWAQQVNSIDGKFQLRNFKLQKNVFDDNHSTRGILLSFETNYRAENKLISKESSLIIHKKGDTLYQSNNLLWIQRAGQWQMTQIFIPYREINLEAGQHSGIELLYLIPSIGELRHKITFEQFTRLAIELEVQQGEIKERLKSWDPSINITSWLPDPYWTIRTGEQATIPIVQTIDTLNSFFVKSEKVRFYILKGETVIWDFWDEDGEEDELLGQYIFDQANGDFKKTYFGQMFGDVKNLDFEISQKILAQQPISLYVNETSHKGKKGVHIDIEYDLARAYSSEKIKPNFIFLDENKNPLTVDLNIFKKMEGAVDLNVFTQLDSTGGDMRYFIPFYFWDSAIRYIQVEFETEKAQKAIGAPRFLVNPIEFDKVVVYSGLDIQQYTKVEGATGVYFRMYYRVREIHQYSKLEIKFLNENEEIATSRIYQIPHSKKTTDIFALDQNHITISAPREQDTLEFFIPYPELKENKFSVEMNMVPDGTVPILREGIIELAGRANLSDAKLELEKETNQFLAGDYGHNYAIGFTLPRFYQNRSKLEIEVKLNGKDFKNYKLISSVYQAENQRMTSGKGELNLLIPLRYMQRNLRVEVEAVILHDEGNILSNKLELNWTVKDETINNRKVSFSVRQLKFDKVWEEAVDTSTGNTPWDYVLMVGSDEVLKLPMKYNFKGQVLKAAYAKELFLHREDLILVYLQHRDRPKLQQLLWEGDLGKLSQNKLSIQAQDMTPVKRISIKSKILN